MFEKLKKYFAGSQNKYTSREILVWLWNAWKGNRFQAFLNATIGLLEVLVSLSAVWAIQNAIDIAAGAKSGSLYWAVGLMALLTLTNFGLNIASVWIRNILGVLARNRMQQRLLDRILKSEWKSKEKRHSGDVINRLQTDVGQVINFLTEVVPSTVSTTTLFLGSFFYLYMLDHALALIIVIMVPVVALLSRIYMKKMRELSKDVRQSDSKVQSVLTETIQNRMLIKIMESDSAMVDKLENTQSELRQNVVKRTWFSVVANFILNIGFENMDAVRPIPQDLLKQTELKLLSWEKQADVLEQRAGLNAGARIRHPHFGEGTILEINESEKTLVIQFDRLPTPRTLGMDAKIVPAR